MVFRVHLACRAQASLRGLVTLRIAEGTGTSQTVEDIGNGSGADSAHSNVPGWRATGVYELDMVSASGHPSAH